MTIDGNLTGDGSATLQDKENETASQTEAEKIAALQKQTEEQATLNSTLTHELETLRAQLKEREELGAARRKNSKPKNLVFDSVIDGEEREGDDDEEKTPEQSGLEQESDGSPPRLLKKKEGRGVKAVPPVKPIRINLGDPLPSDITPEALAAVLDKNHARK